MNKEWSDLNKEMQVNFKKASTFSLGINSLLSLREKIKEAIDHIYNNCKSEDYFLMPLRTDKTIAYYLWHMTRIEDIVANSLINYSEQIFFKNGYDKSIHSPIITTGNELKKDEIVDFSKMIDINSLYKYFIDVTENTNKIINNLIFSDLKRTIDDKRKGELLSLNVVSTDKDAFWLVDYWCGKTYLGLIQMPFSRHLIMHTEGYIRIFNNIYN